MSALHTCNSVIEWAGKPVASVKKSFAAAVARAGLDDVTPHTAATWMAEAGTPIIEIAKLLGHTDPRVTYNTYARLAPDYLQGAAKALRF
jgi:integrase